MFGTIFSAVLGGGGGLLGGILLGMLGNIGAENGNIISAIS